MGKRADLIVLDRNSTTFAGASYAQVLDAFVFAGQPNPVSDVMVAGDWVVKAGKHAKEDEVFARYNELVGRIAAKMEGAE